jgi:pimeloyl-ACP methyl ester carboxylesterase
MRQSLAQYSEPVSFVRTPSWADFTITTTEFEFSVHTPAGAGRGHCSLASRRMCHRISPAIPKVSRADRFRSRRHSATPKGYETFVDQISKMWAEQPNWSDAQLKAIDTPVLVIDGDHDEAIKREHTEYIAATIPHAGLLILPNTSHFAFLQDPRQFNFAILHFLGDE